MTGSYDWPIGRARDGGIDELPIPGSPGRLWLCGKHVVGPDPHLALARVGADSIVCLNESHELADRYPDYVELLRSARSGLVLWRPVPDLSALSLDSTILLVQELRELLDQGRGLIVHCGAGIGRAGTLAVAVLLDYGVALDRARAEVAGARPLAGPEAGVQDQLVIDLAGYYANRLTDRDLS